VNARVTQVYDTLNEMHSPNFSLAIRLQGAPSTPPSGVRLRHQLEQWLSALDPDEAERQLASQGFEALPAFPWSHGRWSLLFIAVPKPLPIRGSAGVRPIGLTMPESGRVRHPSIGRAVRDKARKYGKLDLPLIIAVNASGLYLRTPQVLQYHVMEEFFGPAVGIDSLRSDGTIDRRIERKLNGAWLGPQGPRNTRVSAVLIVACSDPWTLASQTPVLFHHPWAEHPLPQDRWALSQWAVDLRRAHMDERSGRSVAEVLSLPNPWPPLD
jgi:hypothetical protein